MNIRPIAPDECAAAAEVLARSFHEFSLHVYLFPDPERRPRQLRWLFHRAALMYSRVGGAFMADDGSGAALWAPPRHWRGLGAGHYLRAGFLAAPWRLGCALPGRRIRALLDLERRHHTEIREPHWSLEVLGVDPERQRTGSGSALIRHVLAQADRDRLPCYVITHDAKNVAYYERHGFRLVDDTPFEPGAPPTCSMIRPAVES